jgi:ABC-type branched-subunit amino acid transport system permease subunit
LSPPRWRLTAATTASRGRRAHWCWVRGCSRAIFFYAILALLIATYVFISRLIASRFGRVLRGLTDNETRMQAIGFTAYPYRLVAYVIAGTICGLAGFLLGNQAEFVSPAFAHWQRSGELIIMVLLGGTGTLYGPILGALTFLMLEETLSRLTEHWKVILGPLLVLVVLFARGGIAGAIDAWQRGSMAPAELLVAAQRACQGAVTEGAKRCQLWGSTLNAQLERARQLARRGIAVAASHWRRR